MKRTFAALTVSFVAVTIMLALTAGPAAAQQYRPFRMYSDQNMWSAPAGQGPLTALENTGIPPFKTDGQGGSSAFFYDGSNRYFRDRWSGGGPGVGGDSGLSVIGQFP